MSGCNSLDEVDSSEAQIVTQGPIRDAVPGLNQYSSFGGANRIYNFEGALVERVGGQHFQYDTSERLFRVTDSAGVEQERYLYDADNRRVAKGTTTPSGVEWTIYTYDMRWRVMEERVVSASGTTVARQYVDGAGIDEHLQMQDVPSGADFYYHCNSQGFVGVLADSVGTPVLTYEYSWLGQPTKSGTGVGGAADGNAYLFQGRRFDETTGLYQFRNRYYDPEVGEFWTIDPTGVWRHRQGNGYSAFSSDVWGMKDPHGLMTYEECVDRCKGYMIIASSSAAAGCAVTTAGYLACLGAAAATIGSGYTACVALCKWKYGGGRDWWKKFCERQGKGGLIDVSGNREHPSAGSGWGHEAGGFGK